MLELVRASTGSISGPRRLRCESIAIGAALVGAPLAAACMGDLADGVDHGEGFNCKTAFTGWPLENASVGLPEVKA